MKPRTVLTVAAALVAVATLVLAGVEVARRFRQDVNTFELLFAISAVVTSLVCIGVLDWARNLGATGPRYSPDEEYEVGAPTDRGYMAATVEDTRLLDAVHELERLANEELGADKAIEAAIGGIARFANAATVALWLADASGGLTPRAAFADGETRVGEDSIGETADDEAVQQAAELRKPFEAIGEETASFVSPLVISQRCIGVLKAVVPVVGSDEERHNTLQKLGAGLVQLAQHLARAVQAPDLYDQAVTDPSTRLYTRRHFINRLAEATGGSRRYGEPLALALFDIDSFKVCNQTYGHATGDRVLQTLATLVQENIRDADSAYRYGPDEIALILPETDVDRAAVLAERLRQTIRANRTLCDDGGTIITTVSVGVAEFDEDMRGIGQLIARAEEALYAAKASGHDRVQRWAPDSSRGHDLEDE